MLGPRPLNPGPARTCAPGQPRRRPCGGWRTPTQAGSPPGRGPSSFDGSVPPRFRPSAATSGGTHAKPPQTFVPRASTSATGVRAPTRWPAAGTLGRRARRNPSAGVYPPAPGRQAGRRHRPVALAGRPQRRRRRVLTQATGPAEGRGRTRSPRGLAVLCQPRMRGSTDAVDTMTSRFSRRPRCPETGSCSGQGSARPVVALSREIRPDNARGRVRHGRRRRGDPGRGGVRREGHPRQPSRPPGLLGTAIPAKETCPDRRRIGTRPAETIAPSARRHLSPNCGEGLWPGRERHSPGPCLAQRCASRLSEAPRLHR